MMPVTVVNVGYRSTNFWVVSQGTSRLLVDLGWPGTMGTMRANLQRAGVPLSEIRYGLATHWTRQSARRSRALARDNWHGLKAMPSIRSRCRLG
jgi:hypothetical protein